MKTAILIVVIILAAVLQISFFAALRPWGVVPNLLLVVGLLAAVYLEASTAVALALLGGLMTDLASGSDFGLRMVVYGLIVMVAVAVRRGGFELHRLGALVLAVTLGSLSFDLAVMSSLIVEGGWRRSLIGVFLVRFGIGVTLNILLLILVLPLAHWALRERDGLRPGVSL